MGHEVPGHLRDVPAVPRRLCEREPGEVSFVDPRFEDESSGTSGDDHPHGDVRSGEASLAQVYNPVVTSSAWERTLLIVNCDEWGGFYDHVPPQQAPDDPSNALRGFRVPALVVSPRRRGAVAKGVYDTRRCSGRSSGGGICRR